MATRKRCRLVHPEHGFFVILPVARKLRQLGIGRLENSTLVYNLELVVPKNLTIVLQLEHYRKKAETLKQKYSRVFEPVGEAKILENPNPDRGCLFLSATLLTCQSCLDQTSGNMVAPSECLLLVSQLPTLIPFQKERIKLFQGTSTLYLQQTRVSSTRATPSAGKMASGLSQFDMAAYYFASGCTLLTFSF